jgi:hypothetical protein
MLSRAWRAGITQLKPLTSRGQHEPLTSREQYSARASLTEGVEPARCSRELGARAALS